MGFSDQCPCQHRKSSNRPWAPFLFVSWCLQQKPKQHSNNRRNESHVDIRSFFFGVTFHAVFASGNRKELDGSKLDFGDRNLVPDMSWLKKGRNDVWMKPLDEVTERGYIYIIYVCIYESRKLDIWNLSRYQWTIIRYYESKTLWKT